MARERSNRPGNRVTETERRRARQARNKQKNRLMRVLAGVGMGVLAVLIIAGLALPSFGGGQSTGLDDFLQRGGFLARPENGPGMAVADLGRLHFQGLDVTADPGYYNSAPPTSGTHSPTWVRCGIFTEPVADELQVHNLEHGFVTIQYNTTDAALIGELEAAARGLPDWPNYYIFAPYPDMEQTIAMTAWNRVLYLDAVDEDAMEEFADAYLARGPEVARGCDAPGVMAQGVPDPTATPEDGVVDDADAAADAGDGAPADDGADDASDAANGDVDAPTADDADASATPDAG